jgi:CRP-like cAMP-binding protein
VGESQDIGNDTALLLRSSDPRLITFYEGHFVFKAGEESCDGCWFLVQGKIAMLDVSGKKISEISGPSIFGERAFILRRTHSCSAQAIEQSKVVFIDKDNFPEMVAKKPKILDLLLTKWFRRLQQALDATRNLSAKVDKLTEENRALTAKKEDLIRAIGVLQNNLDTKDEQFGTFIKELTAAINWLHNVAQEIPYAARGEKLSQAVVNLVDLIKPK